jgi:hypothetical protein
MSKTIRHLGTLLVMAMCMGWLSACKPVAPAAQALTASAVSPADADTSSVTSDSVNYTLDLGMQFTLYDLSKTPPVAVGGGFVDSLVAGGQKGCCLSLPKKWHAGMKVRVQWSESDHDRIYDERKQDLEIPRYDKPADLYVVFYPGHEVEVVVSPAEPGHPDWRGRIKQSPWEYCLANNERKVCKRATAKLFDTHQVGFCTDTKAADFPKENYDGELLCAAAMHQCMQDYEDEPFCKGILWGERKK